MCDLMVNGVKRRVPCFPKTTYYKPREIPLCDLETNNLSIEELEAIRLCDLLQIEQNEAADRMGISRKTFWNDSAKCEHEWESKCNEGRPTNCLKCGSGRIYRIGGDGRGKRLIENDYCCPQKKGTAV